MKSDFKKIIASEGLVLIGLIALTFISYFASGYISAKVPEDYVAFEELPDEAQKAWREAVEAKYPDFSTDEKQNRAAIDDLEINGNFYSKYHPELERYAGINYKDGISKQELKKAHDFIVRMERLEDAQKILSSFIPPFLWLVVYPFYWLIRFIIWAIKTLRGR